MCQLFEISEYSLKIERSYFIPHHSKSLEDDLQTRESILVYDLGEIWRAVEQQVGRGRIGRQSREEGEGEGKSCQKDPR